MHGQLGQLKKHVCHHAKCCMHVCLRTLSSEAPCARLADSRARTGDHNHLALERSEVGVLGQWIRVRHDSCVLQ